MKKQKFSIAAIYDTETTNVCVDVANNEWKAFPILFIDNDVRGIDLAKYEPDNGEIVSFYRNSNEYIEKILKKDYSALLSDGKNTCLIISADGYLLNYQSFVKNAKEIRDILNNTNTKMVIQGHFHAGKDTLIGKIRYYTLAAMCEGENNPYEILEIL